MAGVSLRGHGYETVRVVKMPSRRFTAEGAPMTEDDRWHVELYRDGSPADTTYPDASLFLTRGEAAALVDQLMEALT
jgi:hypothetical protein